MAGPSWRWIQSPEHGGSTFIRNVLQDIYRPKRTSADQQSPWSPETLQFWAHYKCLYPSIGTSCTSQPDKDGARGSRARNGVICWPRGSPDTSNANKDVPYSVSAVRWHWQRGCLQRTFHFSISTMKPSLFPSGLNGQSIIISLERLG